jgi:hypothetical protein
VCVMMLSYNDLVIINLRICILTLFLEYVTKVRTGPPQGGGGGGFNEMWMGSFQIGKPSIPLSLRKGCLDFALIISPSSLIAGASKGGPGLLNLRICG